MDNWCQGQSHQVRKYAYNQISQYILDGDYNWDKKYNQKNYGNKNDRVEFMFHIEIENLVLGKLELIRYILRI